MPLRREKIWKVLSGISRKGRRGYAVGTLTPERVPSNTYYVSFIRQTDIGGAPIAPNVQI